MGIRDEGVFDQALERAGDGAFVIAADGRIVLWNHAAERIVGYTAQEALGRSCCDLLAGRDDDGNRLCHKGCRVITLVKMGDPVQNFDMQTRTKAGRSVWLNMSIVATPNGPRGPLTVHLFRDVTAAKELLNLVRQNFAARAPGSLENNDDLTKRELEILRLLANGESTRAVADRLHVSTATVRNHVQNILGKLGVHSRLQAVAYATTHRLLKP